MKQILIIVVFASVTTFVCSCKKTSQQYLRSSFEKTDDGSSAVEPAKVIAGNWQTARWQSFQIEEAGSLLRGKIHIDEQQSLGQEYVKFAYVRNRGREEYVFQSLPTMFNGGFEMKYDFSGEALSISIFPDENLNLPEVSQVSDIEFRYVLVPVEIYTTHMIDWSDYNAVAEALNI